jgi:hypothetical protein
MSLQTQAEALLADAGLSDSREIVVKPYRPSPAEHLEAIQLYEQGHSFKAIAEKLDRDPETISKLLHGYMDSAELARKWLTGKALDMAQAWTSAAEKSASKGFHTAAKEALLYSKVIEPIEDSGSGGNRVNVMIGIPGSPVPLPSVQVVKDQ